MVGVGGTQPKTHHTTHTHTRNAKVACCGCVAAVGGGEEASDRGEGFREGFGAFFLVVITHTRKKHSVQTCDPQNHPLN